MYIITFGESGDLPEKADTLQDVANIIIGYINYDPLYKLEDIEVFEIKKELDIEPGNSIIINNKEYYKK